MFHLRRISKSVTVGCRLLSSSPVKPPVGVSVDSEGIAIVQLDRPPVNSLGVEVLQKLYESICEVEKNKCKGLILTSASPTIFSAGLDFNEFLKPHPERCRLFTDSVLDVALKLFGTDIITTVAINGYAGAGACILATTCDYRAMTTGQSIIGLNDTTVGIPPAVWIYHLMARLMQRARRMQNTPALVPSCTQQNELCRLDSLTM
ncbi:hypothetical protein PYW08_013267 [Mythimna loreyi]|uniref:Uncharacterized protein n=1 Tax=Mythimna loreyi TaxID=667449 RepID=A0ACC2QGA0_9NEOP|nr:hypothetical protein PYW08_013267 [Mythimna loreyi]